MIGCMIFDKNVFTTHFLLIKNVYGIHLITIQPSQPYAEEDLLPDEDMGRFRRQEAPDDHGPQTGRKDVLCNEVCQRELRELCSVQLPGIHRAPQDIRWGSRPPQIDQGALRVFTGDHQRRHSHPFRRDPGMRTRRDVPEILQRRDAGATDNHNRKSVGTDSRRQRAERIGYVETLLPRRDRGADPDESDGSGGICMGHRQKGIDGFDPRTFQRHVRDAAA